jgi:hypothetical protein
VTLLNVRRRRLCSSAEKDDLKSSVENSAFFCSRHDQSIFAALEAALTFLDAIPPEVKCQIKVNHGQTGGVNKE